MRIRRLRAEVTLKLSRPIEARNGNELLAGVLEDTFYSGALSYGAINGAPSADQGSITTANVYEDRRTDQSIMGLTRHACDVISRTQS